jgi:uncharacterized membrane protein
LLRDSQSRFRRVVMLEYPRKGVWTLGFVTGSVGSQMQSRLTEPMISVFIPTTPNPTSGWYAMVPEDEVVNLTISIEDAFKVLISGGIVNPEEREMERRSPRTGIPLNLPRRQKSMAVEELGEAQVEMISLEEEV